MSQGISDQTDRSIFFFIDEIYMHAKSQQSFFVWFVLPIIFLKGIYVKISQ